MSFFGQLIFGPILNFIGGSLRWVYGTIWRTLFKRPKFTFKEYLYGPKNSEDWFDQTGHGCVNRIIGLVGAALLIYGLGSLVNCLFY